MNSQEEEGIQTRRHLTGFDRTVVIGDLHGDLGALLISLADKKIIQYSGRQKPVAARIKSSLNHRWSKGLESMVVRQTTPLQLVFLGDLFDRWSEGCHIVQFLSKIRWERFNIEPVYILGNHDIHNYHFFVNPYRVFEIYSESELPQSRRLEYLSGMGLNKSLEGFLDLHRTEITTLQKQFYKTGVLDWDLGYGRITLAYSQDLTFMKGFRGPLTWEQICRKFSALIAKTGHAPDPDMKAPIEEFMERLGAFENPRGQNWWSIQPPHRYQESEGGYTWDLLFFNLLMVEHNDEDLRASRKTYRDIMLIDWRVISLVWRKHYGPFFKKFKQMHLEGDTLYVHGGLSPRVMLDSQAFGIIYRAGTGEHLDIRNVPNYDIHKVVDRCNRLATQVMVNGLNDFSFTHFCGAEIFDGMGVWRGGRYGFTQFGCVFWADFEYLRRELAHESIRRLYQQFVEATGIRRVICGHTRFWTRDPEVRYLIIRELAKQDLDYLCVDNSCSRGYSGSSKINGIEINAQGLILDKGEYRGI